MFIYPYPHRELSWGGGEGNKIAATCKQKWDISQLYRFLAKLRATQPHESEQPPAPPSRLGRLRAHTHNQQLGLPVYLVTQGRLPVPPARCNAGAARKWTLSPAGVVSVGTRGTPKAFEGAAYRRGANTKVGKTNRSERLSTRNQSTHFVCKNLSEPPWVSRGLGSPEFFRHRINTRQLFMGKSCATAR